MAPHTHYGIQPAEADGTFVDGINAIADPDGRRLDLPAIEREAAAGIGNLAFGVLVPGEDEPAVLATLVVEEDEAGVWAVLGGFLLPVHQQGGH